MSIRLRRPRSFSCMARALLAGLVLLGLILFITSHSEKSTVHKSKMGGKPRQTLASKNISMDIKNLAKISMLYKETCQETHLGTSIKLSKPWIRIKSIILVVVFNYAESDTLPYNELLYRPFFQNIVYCVPPGGNFTQLQNLHWNLRIVRWKGWVPNGIHNYICVHHVHQLGLKGKGFLFVVDDLLFSLSFISSLDLNKPAVIVKGRECDIARPKYNKCDEWPFFKLATKQLRSTFNETANSYGNSLIKRCRRVIRNLTHLQEPLFHANPDIIYIPNTYMKDLSSALEIFHSHHVAHDLVLKYMLTCLAWPASPTELVGHMNWERDRCRFYKYLPGLIKGETPFLHPVKLSGVPQGEEEYVKSFCQTVLPYLHRKPSN